MTDRPILRLANGRVARRMTGQPDRRPRPRSQGAAVQGRRLGAQFDRLEAALAGEDPDVVLRRDPGGIAPERALVFITAVPISNFVRASRLVGLEVLAELDLDDDYLLDEELIVENRDMVSPTLYATMPTVESFERILRLWRAYRRGEQPEDGHAPWRQLFDMLNDLRAWGPEDRFSVDAREELQARIADDDEASPAISTAHGPGPFGAIKPDLLASGGRHDVRAVAAGDSLRLRVIRESGRSGVFVASARGGSRASERARGTSCAAALTTRSVLRRLS